MKSSFALAAAVLVALGGGASAKTKTETVSLDGHCDVLTLQIDKNAVAGVDVPTCAHGFGAGFIGKIKGFGNAIVAGVQFSEEPGVQLVFRVQYPLVTGGAWDLSETNDGVSFSQIESGTYTVEGTAAKGPRGATSVVRDIVKGAGK
jgi:hypothetical protein